MDILHQEHRYGVVDIARCNTIAIKLNPKPKKIFNLLIRLVGGYNQIIVTQWMLEVKPDSLYKW